MKLYHGGLAVVQKPQMVSSVAGRSLDFGFGFYTTTSLEQARRWVAFRQRSGEVVDGFVSCYEVADDVLSMPDIKCLVFKNASNDWLDFVMRNREDPFFESSCFSRNGEE